MRDGGDVDADEGNDGVVGPGDNVRCFHCDGGLKNWQQDDNAAVEHARWFPRCSYIQQKRDSTFVTDTQRRTVVVVPVLTTSTALSAARRCTVSCCALCGVCCLACLYVVFIVEAL